MEHNWLLYLAVFSVAFAVTVFVTPFVRDLARKWGAMDYPKSRGLNNEPVPLMGGLAIFIGFVAALSVTVVFVDEFHTKQFIGLVIGGLIIVIAGILDDIYELSPKMKLSFQLVAACVVVFTGTKIDVIMWPFWEVLKPLAPIFTIIWIIGLVNAVNLIDGVDGLAAGVTSIAAVCLTILCVISGSTQLAVVLPAILAGACLGFLPRNFSPAELFMGDTGSMFLGYVLAVSSCIGVYKSYALLSIVISVFAMALPILDTLFAMLRRAIHHKPIMMADRGHLHHRLIDSGCTHKQAVMILYGLSTLSAILAVLIAIKNFRVTIVVFIFFFVLLMMVYVYIKRVSVNKKKDSEEDEEDV